MFEYLGIVVTVDENGNRHNLSVMRDFANFNINGVDYSTPGEWFIIDQYDNDIAVIDYDNGEFLIPSTNTKLTRIT